MDKNNAPFRIGQRVICVNEVPATERLYETEIFPAKHQKLTVGSVHKNMGLWWVRFEEIINIKMLYSDGFTEASFDSRDFAPIEESRERVKYVAVSETLRGKAQQLVIENCKTS